MSLEIYIDRYKHYEGKEYLNAMIRDAKAPNGAALHVTNWSKTVSDDFSVGQVGWQSSSYLDVSRWHANEGDKRLRRGYSLEGDAGWNPLTPRQQDNLMKKGVSFASVINGTTIPATLGQPQPAFANYQAPDPDEVPGSTVLAPKRMEWVIEHPDHPEAFSQMMHLAGQLQKTIDDAEVRTAKAKTDLEFAKAWMSARMRKEAG